MIAATLTLFATGTWAACTGRDRAAALAINLLLWVGAAALVWELIG